MFAADHAESCNYSGLICACKKDVLGNDGIKASPVCHHRRYMLASAYICGILACCFYVNPDFHIIFQIV
jgi:hypothetical protein